MRTGLRSKMRTFKGFTLIELLVVIAIIALLISILLPALSTARKEAQAIKSGVSLRNVAQAVVMYTIDGRTFPASYLNKRTGARAGEWFIEDQQGTNPDGGYLHWSFFLFEGGKVPLDAFTNPAARNGGGAPRTNPGDKPEDRDAGQTFYQAPSATLVDEQVPRIAFGGNAALFPRNKFVGGETLRRNRFVQPSEVDASTLGSSKTILAAEFATTRTGQWNSVFETDGLSKSHRPITPFVGSQAGFDVLNEPDGNNIPRVDQNPTGARFRYPTPEEIDDPNSIDMTNSIDRGLSAVGRIHPGGKGGANGSANFVFVDTHIERTTVYETVRKRLWGDKFWSLTGANNRVNLFLNPAERW